MGTTKSGSSFKLEAEYILALDTFLFNRGGPTWTFIDFLKMNTIYETEDYYTTSGILFPNHHSAGGTAVVVNSFEVI